MSSNHDHKVYEEMAKRNIEAFVQSLEDARAGLGSAASADEALNQKAKEILRANEHLLQGPRELHSCGGPFVYAAIAIWGTFASAPTLDFAGWGSLKFAGTHWGAGAGAGISYMVGYSTVDPGKLPGHMKYRLFFSPGTPATVTADFYRDDALMVSIIGPAASVSTGGVFWGEGDFKK